MDTRQYNVIAANERPSGTQILLLVIAGIAYMVAFVTSALGEYTTGILAAWVIASALIGKYATIRGHSYWYYFLGGVLINPVLAGILLLIKGTNQAAIEKQQVLSGQMKQCPYCAELIQAEAIKCRYCQSNLT